MRKNIVKTGARIFQTIVEKLLGLSVMAITVLVFIQVLSRYVFKTSLKGVEEVPVFLMIICVYLASGLLAKDNKHIKIDMVQLFVKNPKKLMMLDLFMQFITFVSLAGFTYLTYDYILFTRNSGTVSPGLQIPMWFIQSFMLLGVFLMAANYLMNIIEGVKEVKEWK